MTFFNWGTIWLIDEILTELLNRLHLAAKKARKLCEFPEIALCYVETTHPKIYLENRYCTVKHSICRYTTTIVRWKRKRKHCLRLTSRGVGIFHMRILPYFPIEPYGLKYSNAFHNIVIYRLCRDMENLLAKWC